jgi:hypothetical protein
VLDQGCARPALVRLKVILCRLASTIDGPRLNRFFEGCHAVSSHKPSVVVKMNYTVSWIMRHRHQVEEALAGRIHVRPRHALTLGSAGAFTDRDTKRVWYKLRPAWSVRGPFEHV